MQIKSFKKKSALTASTENILELSVAHTTGLHTRHVLMKNINEKDEPP